MAKLWRPDTCGCEIEFEADWKTLKGVRKVCPAHQGQPNHAAVHKACRDENTSKNHAHGAVRALLGIEELKNEPDTFRWSIDQNRDVEVWLADRHLTAEERSQIAQRAKQRGAKKKVVVR